jgi:hypothetical protein
MGKAMEFYAGKYKADDFEVRKVSGQPGHGGYDISVTIGFEQIKKVEVKGRLVKRGPHPHGIPDMHYTEIDETSRQLVADELCVVFFFPDSERYEIAIIPREKILPSHIEDLRRYRIRSAAKNRGFIKEFLQDCNRKITSAVE